MEPPFADEATAPGTATGNDLDLEVEVVAEASLPEGLDPDQLRDIVGFVLGREGASGPWQVAVAVVDDERLRALHRDFMGLDTPTDVMTFPLGDADLGAGEARGGDVVVSVERAAEQAPAFGHTAAAEVRFLVVHGLLHLCGWDDGTDEQRARMLARQAALLNSFDGVFGDEERELLAPEEA